MSALQKPSYTQVKDRFEALRISSRDAASNSLPAYLRNKFGKMIPSNDVSLDGFNLAVQKELRVWENSGMRRVAWDWDKVQRKYRTHPKRFELSVWYRDNTLCSAAIGRPTWGGGKLRLDYLESAPLGTVLDGLVTDIAIAAGIFYARSIGASQIRIMNPVNSQVRDHYLSKPRFSYNERGDYCYRDLV